MRALLLGGCALLILGGQALPAPPAPSALEPGELRCTFTKGDTFVLTFNDAHGTTVEAPQIGEMRVTFDLVLEAAVTVQSVTDTGHAKLKCKIARWRTAMDNGQDGSGFELDTRPLRGRPDRKIAGLNGKPFTIDITTRGEVQKVDGLTKLLRVMAAAAQDPKTATTLLHTECSDDALRHKLQECWGPWPAEAVDTSASWPQACTSTLAITGNAMTAAGNVTLGTCTAATAEVKLSGAVTGTSGRATLWDDDDADDGKGTGVGRRGGFDMGAMLRRVLRNTEVDFTEGTFEGARTLDRTAGRVTKSHSLWVSTVTLNITMPQIPGMGGGGGGEPRAVPAKIEQRRELRCAPPGKQR